MPVRRCHILRCQIVCHHVACQRVGIVYPLEQAILRLQRFVISCPRPLQRAVTEDLLLFPYLICRIVLTASGNYILLQFVIVPCKGSGIAGFLRRNRSAQGFRALNPVSASGHACGTVCNRFADCSNDVFVRDCRDKYGIADHIADMCAQVSQHRQISPRVPFVLQRDGHLICNILHDVVHCICTFLFRLRLQQTFLQSGRHFDLRRTAAVFPHKLALYITHSGFCIPQLGCTAQTFQQTHGLHCLSGFRTDICNLLHQMRCRGDIAALHRVVDQLFTQRDICRRRHPVAFHDSFKLPCRRVCSDRIDDSASLLQAFRIADRRV